MGVSLSWESTCLASRGSRVRISPSPLPILFICIGLRTLKTAYREHIYSNEPGTYGAGLAKFDNRGHSGIHKPWMIKKNLWIADIITLYDVGRTVDRS